MTDIKNLGKADPFAEAEGDLGGEDGYIHIRIQQRNGRKTLTTVQGISSEKYDLKRVVKYCKKLFSCNGTVVEHPEYGEVIQLQGDQRDEFAKMLVKGGMATADQVKVHGF